MLNRRHTFRFALIALALITISSLTVAANWGSSWNPLGLFAPTEATGSAADAQPASTNAPETTQIGSAAFATTVTTNSGSGLAPTYPDLAAAVIALNAATITSPVVITVSGTETTPAGGYSITATGTAANTIIIDGTGATTITAFTPQVTGSAASSFDAIFKIVGGDFITIQGFSMAENAGNTVITPGTTNTMTEFGVLLVHGSATDGAQNNTIQNNVIALTNTYTNSVGIFSTSASSSVNGTLEATSTAGTNSNNKIYGNNISNVAYGVEFICPPITATIFETGNDIGGSIIGNANTITFGNAAAQSGAWNRSTSTNQAGILYRNGAGVNIRFNTITSNSAAYVGSAGLNGIQISSGSTPTGVTYTSTISDNTVNLTSTGIALVTGIDFGHGLSTGTIVASNNNVTVNQTSSAANAAAAIGIKANYASASNTGNSNTVVINQSSSAGALSGAATGITLAGTAATTITSNSNNVTLNVTGTGTGTITGAQTGISVAGTSTTNTVNSNTILFNQTTSVATGITTGAITGVLALSPASVALNIGSANQISVKQSATGAGTYGTNAVTYLSISAAHKDVNITGNSFNTTGSTIRSTGALDVILGGSSTLTGILTITGNTANIDRVAGSGNVGFYTQTSTSPNDPTDNISSNNLTFTGLAGTSTATVINRLGGSTTATRVISSNTISVSGTNSGNVFGIISGFSGTTTMNLNSVTISSAGALLTGISQNSSGVNSNITNSALSLTTSATLAPAMQGINVVATGAHVVTGNAVNTMSVTGITTTTPVVSGIVILAGSSANIAGNIVTGLSVGAAGSTSSATVDGILISGSSATNISKNKIYGISTLASGSSTIVSGIRLTAGPTNTVSNNLIGGLTANASTNTDSIRGINITSALASSSNNVFFNTVFLNASAGGANFGSTGIFHASSATSTTATLNLRNNIIVNTSFQAGTGLTVAFRRSAGSPGALANYGAASNNNDFYAGTPSAANLIYSDGTSNAQTFALYKSGVFTAGTVSPRDQASFSELPPFLSTNGALATFLHINPAVATQVESGGSIGTGITDDFDGQARSGTAPDIGADEFVGIGIDLSAPAISYTALGNGAAVATRVFSNVTITDTTGVNTTPGTKPRLYYKKSVGDANDLTGWKFVEANGTTSPYDFTINYAALNAGSVTVGDTIQYFVVAQDTAVPTVGINSGTFAAQPTSVALTGAAFPIGGTINSYSIVPGVSGTLTLDGATYTSLTKNDASGIFKFLNGGVLTGNVTINLTADSLTEDGAVALNQLAEEPSGSNFTVTIKATGAPHTISGSIASAALIKLNGADRVTFDGSGLSLAEGLDLAPAPEAAANLTIVNTATTAPTVISMVSLGTGSGSSNNTIKNCNISTGVNATTGYGVSIGGSTPGTSGADNDSNTILNNNITAATIGVYANGTAAVSTGGDDALNISGNTIDVNNALQTIGIEAGNSTGSVISGNTISGQTSGALVPVGISLETGFVSSAVANNLITKELVTNTGGYGGRGITIGTGTASSALTISNNAIYGVNGSNWSGFVNASSMGIVIGTIGGSQASLATVAGGINLYFNSVNMTGSLGVGSTTAITTALYVGTGSSSLDIRNNTLVNTMTGVNSTQKNYAIYSAAANTVFPAINYNDYYVSNTFTASAIPGFLTSDRVDLAGIQAGFGQNVNSMVSNPLFNSASDLRPQTGSPLVGAGISGTGVLTDILGVTRSTGIPPSGPTIGAYETSVDGIAPAITYTPLANTTSIADRTLTATITDSTAVATGGNAPRVYFNKNGGAYFSNACSLTSGTVQNGTWDCVISSSAVGGVGVSDVIRYFVVAQDTLGNLASNASAGFTGTSVNSVTTPPTTPNSYLIAGAIGGPLTVDGVGGGGNFASLTNPGGVFEYINNNVVTSNITVNLTADLTAETGAVALNAFASPNTVTVQPSGAARIVSGTVPGTAMIRLNGASRVTFDGSVGGGGTDRSLTISNTSVSGPQVVRFGSIGTTPITNDTLKNCVIINGVNTASAIVTLDTAGSLSGYFNNITIQNNDIQRAFIGTFNVATVAPGNGSGLSITQNKIDTAGANAVRDIGIYVQGVDGVTVGQNTVGNFNAASEESDTGIWLATGTVNATVSGNTVSTIGYTGVNTFSPIGILVTGGTAAANINLTGNTVSAMSNNGTSAVVGIEVANATGGVTIQRNNVSGINNTSPSTYGAFGIDISGGDNNIVKNNFVSNVTGNMTGGAAFSPNFGIVGLRIGSGSGHTIANNSVNMFGLRSGTATTSLLTAALAVVGSTSLNMDIRNNILANNITGGTTAIANVSAYLPSGGTSAMGLTWNNNSYYYGTDAARAGAGQAGATAGTTFFVTLPALTAYTNTLGFATNDNASLASTGAVPYTTANDLHLTSAAPERDTGATIASVTNDIDGDLRPELSDIGADEFLDGNAPDTSIGSNPANPTTSTSATFTFSGSDTLASPEAVASFECDLDGSGFAACTSPKSYVGLASGSHTFQVRAKDGAGNVDPSPASFTWLINQPPTITAVPVSRLVGSLPSNSTIANVTDDGGSGAVTVTVTSVNPLSGVTVSNIQNTGGVITADVVAACGATSASFTLQASDGGLTATDTLSVTVNASPPVLSYTDPATVPFGGSTTINPATGPSDNGSVTNIAIQGTGTYTGNLSVDSVTGIVSVSNAAPAGTHLITIRITDNCGQVVDTTFNLTVGPAVAFSINDVSQFETNSGTTGYSFTVTKTGVTAISTSVTYQTADSSANDPSDYLAAGPTVLTFLPGDTTKPVTITVKGDTSLETDEQFFVNLSSPVNATITDGQGVGTILNDDCVTAPGGMVSWYSGETNAFDIYGPNNGTVNGGVAYGAGKVGANAFDLNGTNGYVGLGNGGSFQLNAMTADAWISPDTMGIGDYETIVSKWQQGADTSWGFFFVGTSATTGRIDGYVNTPGGIVTTNGGTVPVGTGVYSHVAMSYSAADGLRLYVNGVQVATAPATGAMLTSTTPVQIGTDSDLLASRFFDGRIDEVEIFDHALLPAEIQTLSDASGGGKCHVSTLQFATPTYTSGEGAGNASITVSRIGAHDTIAAVDYATVIGGTATGGAACGGTVDYQDTTGTLSFAANEAVKTFNVPVCPDAFNEAAETVNLALANAQDPGITLGAQTTAVLTITDDDSAPTISINDVTQAETNAGTTTFTFNVTLSAPSGLPVSVDYATGDGSATFADNDYLVAAGSLNFTAGQTSKPVTVTVNGDSKFENSEDFFVNLTNPSGATILDAQGLGTITNDDTVPTISINDITLAEGNAGPTSFDFNVTLSQVSGLPVTVHYQTANGSATTVDGDYTAVPDTVVTIPAGSLSRSFLASNAPVFVNGDTKFEGNEDFFVNLTNASGATIADNQAHGVITNDDTAPTISITDVTRAETDAGTTFFAFNATLSAISGLPVTVHYQTADGTATTADGDYVAIADTVLTIPAGSLSRPEGFVTNINVGVNGDTKFEGNETFFVNLSNPSGATIADSQGVGTITNDDTAPTISINDVTVAEGNAGTTTFSFVASLSAVSGLPVTVHYQTNNGSATTADGDYAGVGDTVLTINPGNTTRIIAVGNIPVAVNGDTKYEGNETFTVDLSTPSGATIVDNQGLGTITNDDASPSFAIDDVSHNEGDAGTTTYTFTVTKTGATGLPSSVQYNTVDGTAVSTGGSPDFTALTTQTLNFAANDTSMPVTVLVNGDTTVEPTEFFTVHLSNPIGATISDADGTGTINSDDAVPSIQFASPTYIEDESQTASINLHRTGDLSAPSTVKFSTVAGGTATGGAVCSPTSVDYITVTDAIVTFAIGQADKSASVVICGGDLMVEAGDNINLLVTPDTNGTIGAQSTAVLNINDTASVYRDTSNITLTTGSGATPYGSPITVTGGPTLIGSMRVTLYDVSHVMPANMDVLLEGPGGRKYLMMADTGGVVPVDPSAPVTLSFTDTSSTLVSNSSWATGTFLPTTWEPGQSSFPAPAPAGPYTQAPSTVVRPNSLKMYGTFGLTDANGVWRLWVRDDNGTTRAPEVVVGAIAGGWGLEFLAPTAAGVDVSGRVSTADGHGVQKAMITLTDSHGVTRTALSTSLGYYRFEGVTTGETYIIGVQSKRYTFGERLIQVFDSLADVDLIAQE